LAGRIADAAGADRVSPEAAALARTLRERQEPAGRGERGLYLCHSFCELGATPLADALGDLRDFLVRNPGEVVVVINEDYVRPEDFVAAVTDAGLGELADRGPLADAARNDRRQPARGLFGRTPRRWRAAREGAPDPRSRIARTSC
jgi:hypothetical protein